MDSKPPQARPNQAAELRLDVRYPRGNSGSPVVNRNGELVGTLFDGNIYSLVLDVQYGDERARSVSVHSSGILEALRKVYKAEALVAELLGRNSGGKR